MKRYLAELLGTFTLVFCGTGAIVINQQSGGAVTHVGIATTFGLVVMAMIYTFGSVSGAHLNPAVTLAFRWSGSIGSRDSVAYIGSQVAGALLASGVLWWLFPENERLGATLPAGSAMQSFVLEVLLTFFLMLTILRTSGGDRETRSLAGIAIGGVVLLEAMFAGPVSGASMNPARSLSPAAVSGHWQHLWIYLSAPVLGALLAVPCSRFFDKNN